MTWTLHINRPVPSANDRHVNGRDRVSRAMYRKLRDAWARDLTALAKQAGVTPPWSKRRIVLTRIMGPRQREYDHGNLVGGAKPIIDAMLGPKAPSVRVVNGVKKVTAGRPGAWLISDDSNRWVTVEYRQERGLQPGCRIEIEDVNEGG